MHMVDALISPIVGGAMLAASGSIMAYSAGKIEKEAFKSKLPLMGLAGAFVFAAQMINFVIPGTGASGHLGGGMLLAALLGPYAGFLTMAAILLTQAVFFADGGLLAYGCNVFNLAFYTCFIAYPFIYKPILKKGFSKKNIFIGSMLSSVLGLQLGAFSVVIQTLLSHKSALSFGQFFMAMQPIHLAIGLLEGLITAGVLTLFYKAYPKPDYNHPAYLPKPITRKLTTCFLICILIIGGIFSLFSSSAPDGLEWSVAKITNSQGLVADNALHTKAQMLQDQLAVLPDYSFKPSANSLIPYALSETLGTSASGLLGSMLTFSLTMLIGAACCQLKKTKPVT